jgi:DNA mismatch repair protein MSH3
MVECGYRYRFFGYDAEKAAKILDISAHPDSVGSGILGLTASVPTFNGHGNYVRKLVLQGQKVGVVVQTESSAKKKAYMCIGCW